MFSTSTLIRIGVVLLITVGVCWAVNTFLDYEQKIGYDRRTAEYTEQENKDLKAAIIETGRLQGIVKEAQDARKKQEAIQRQLSERNAVLTGRLRDSDARINSLLSSASTEALTYAVRAYAGLFADCRGAYEEMGRAATGHRNDVKTLDTSWPVFIKEAQ